MFCVQVAPCNPAGTSGALFSSDRWSPIGTVVRFPTFVPAAPTTPKGALRIIDSTLDDLLGADAIAELLHEATGSDLAGERTLSHDQAAAIASARVFTLIPAKWSIATSFNAEEVQELAVLSLQLELVLRQVTEEFAKNGIPSIVLKGLATGRLDYSDSLLRHTGDIDLLIKVDDFAHAQDILESGGYAMGLPIQFDSEFSKGNTWINADGIEVDLHTRLSLHSHQGTSNLFDTAEPFGGFCSYALPREARLVHAASHLYLTAPRHRRLSGTLDISVIRERGVDLRKVQILARELGLEAATCGGLQVEALLFGRPPSDLADWEKPSKLLRLAYGRPDRKAWAEELHRLSTVGSWRLRTRYLYQKVFPNKDVRLHRGGWIEYLKRGL